MYKYLAVISSVCILYVTSGMKPTNEISSHKEGGNSAKYSNIIDDIQFNKIKDSLDNNSNDLESSKKIKKPIQVVDNSKPTGLNSAGKIVRINNQKSYKPHEIKNQKESEQLERLLELKLEQQLDNTRYENYNDLLDSFNSNVMKTLLFYTVENQKKLAEELAKSKLSNLTEEVAKPNLSNLKSRLELKHLREIISYIHNKQDKLNFVLVSNNMRKAYYDMLDKQSAANSDKKDSTK